ncbi:MAG TPA: oxidoreductase, partial [Buttiauxella sp.]|nr:oxidoreductase [Buttiauxella sp.]
RVAAWKRLADLLPESFYEMATTEISLEQAPAVAKSFMSNEIQGRTLVKVS